MTSFAISPFTMPAALAAADDLLGALQQWEGDPGKRAQAEWLRPFRERAAVAAGLSEIARHATERAAQHVEWLKSHHWEAEIQSGAPGAMFLAAVLAIGGKWTTAGWTHSNGKGLVRAVVPNVFVHEERVARMQTRSPGVEFLVRQFSTPVRDERELWERSFELVETTPSAEGMEVGMIDFPLVDLRTRSAADHMVGLHTRTHFIAQAAEGFELKMNHLGGLARARAEVAAPAGPPPKVRWVKITGPFVVAVKKQGIAEPVFAAYVDKDSWRDPGDASV